MKLSKKLRKKLDKHEFSIHEYEDGTVEFGKYSPAGQDFGFTLDVGECENVDDLIRKADEYADNFDPSYEAYLWLDDTGHGTNGAPYEMIDVYNDMVACREIIEEFIDIL